MPLRGSVSNRIHELTHYGSRPRSHRQIVAIALNSARRDAARKGRRRRRSRRG
jgi:hypothetical protein